MGHKGEETARKEEAEGRSSSNDLYELKQF
jgi:hypothetical protein